jgi:hypothetical protein
MDGIIVMITLFGFCILLILRKYYDTNCTKRDDDMPPCKCYDSKCCSECCDVCCDIRCMWTP